MFSNFSVSKWLDENSISVSDEQRLFISNFDCYFADLISDFNSLKNRLDEISLRNLSENIMDEFSVKNKTLAWALIDRSKISLDDGEIVGLREQLELLKKDNSFNAVFYDESSRPVFVSVGKSSKQFYDTARSVMGLNK